MALLSSGKAMKDAGLSLFSKERTGVILATEYGALETTFSFLDSYIEKGDKLALPTSFSNSVHNAAAAHISIGYGMKGPSLTISQFEMSFFSALLTAGAWLETGKTDAVLVGACDACCGVLEYCRDCFSKTCSHTSDAFAEGSVFFLVTGENKTPPKYGYFKDIGMGRIKKKAVGHGRDSGGHEKCFSPTNLARDAALAVMGNQTNFYFRTEINGRYGKMMITAPGAA